MDPSQNQRKRSAVTSSSRREILPRRWKSRKVVPSSPMVERWRCGRFSKYPAHKLLEPTLGMILDAGSRSVRSLIWLVPEIFEIGRDFEIFAAHKLNDALQFVLLFPSHANLPVLQRALHLEARFLNRLDNLLRLFALQALPNLQFLPRVAQRRNIRFHLLDVTQINSPLR